MKNKTSAEEECGGRRRSYEALRDTRETLGRICNKESCNALKREGKIESLRSAGCVIGREVLLVKRKRRVSGANVRSHGMGAPVGRHVSYWGVAREEMIRGDV